MADKVPKAASRTEHTSLRLDADIAEWLDRRCRETGVSRNKGINQILRGYMVGRIKGPTSESL